MAILVAGPIKPGSWWPLLSGLPVLLLAVWLFGSLTNSVGEGEKCWRFGPGRPRNRVLSAAIADAQAVTRRWRHGWDIHFTWFGTLCNVAGFQAVALRLRNGRRLALGTKKPERLLAALGRNPAAR